MLDFFKKMFAPERSSDTAKERLRLVLISDQLALSPEVVEALKNDLFAVISRYVEIDSSHADLTFEHRDREIAMLANIPILGVRDRARDEASKPLSAAAMRPSNTPAVTSAQYEAPPVLSAESQPFDSAVDTADVRYVNRPTETPIAEAPASEPVFDGVDVPAPLTPSASGPARSSIASQPPRRKRKRRSAASIAAAKAKTQQMPPGAGAPELGPA